MFPLTLCDTVHGHSNPGKHTCPDRERRRATSPGKGPVDGVVAIPFAGCLSRRRRSFPDGLRSFPPSTRCAPCRPGGLGLAVRSSRRSSPLAPRPCPHHAAGACVDAKRTAEKSPAQDRARAGMSNGIVCELELVRICGKQETYWCNLCACEWETGNNAPRDRQKHAQRHHPGAMLSYKNRPTRVKQVHVSPIPYLPLAYSDSRAV